MKRTSTRIFKKGDRVIASDLAVREGIFPVYIVGTIVSYRNGKRVRVNFDGQVGSSFYSLDFWRVVPDSLLKRTRRRFKGLKFALPEEIAGFVQVELDRARGIAKRSV